MSIAETSLDIDQLAEECQRELNRRYAFQRMLSATDTVLFWLEDLNKDGVTALPASLGLRIRDALRELPATCLATPAGGSVQQVLDGVFATQDALLAMYVPGYEREAGEADDAR